MGCPACGVAGYLRCGYGAVVVGGVESLNFADSPHKKAGYSLVCCFTDVVVGAPWIGVFCCLFVCLYPPSVLSPKPDGVGAWQYHKENRGDVG